MCIFFFLKKRGLKCLPSEHSNLEIKKRNHFVFNSRPLSVLPSMRDKALELKHNLCSSDGKTLPVGGATAVWRVTSHRALLCPLLDYFRACWSLLRLLCVIRTDNDHGNLLLFNAGGEPRWSKSHIKTSKQTQMQMDSVFFQCTCTKPLGFDFICGW